MTKDLRQAILALTNAAKAVARGEGHMDERLIDNVLALMPAGPILETLWAGLPAPVNITKVPQDGEMVRLHIEYPSVADADRTYYILREPRRHHDLLIDYMRVAANAASAKAKLEREHALEKRLLAERDAFDASAPDNPLRIAMAEELNGALMHEYPTGLDISGYVAETMARLSEAATKPLHVPAAEVEGDGQED